MEFTIHHQVLLSVFVVALIMGAVVNKTNFCTMGAVSDWVNMGDTGRLRAWLWAIAIAIIGVLVLEGSGVLQLNSETFPPYRTGSFAWLRYLLGGFAFGIGMTLASGCGNKTLVRFGAGNLKSLVVLIIAAIAAYFMLWTDFFSTAFMSWISPTIIELQAHGIPNQSLQAIIGAPFDAADSAVLHWVIGAALVLGLFYLVFKSKDFRGSFDNILGGSVVGLAVLLGWYITGGPMGQAWAEWADFASEVPSRVATQSYTFISPMGDGVRYLMQPTKLSLVNFGITAMLGVILGSFIWSLVARSFRIEWFVNLKDFANHAIGGVLMGIGGILAMGCTVGQAITGVSTLALGSMLTFGAIVFGSALTMKVQYHALDDLGLMAALRAALSDMHLLPAAK